MVGFTLLYLLVKLNKITSIDNKHKHIFNMSAILSSLLNFIQN